MNLSTRHLAFLSLILAASIWGATAAVMKIALLTVPPFTLAFIRFGAASLLLLPFVIGKLKIKEEDFPLFVIATFCAITFHIPFFFFGLKLTTALNASIIASSLPLLTLLFAHTFLYEKISNKLIFATLLGIGGIAIIIGKDVLANGVSLSPLGDMLILLATLTFVFYEIVSKKLFKKYKPTVITFYVFVLGSLTLLPSAVLENQLDASWITHLSWVTTGGVLYGIFCSSFLAYTLWEWGLSKIDASRVGFFFYLDPIVGTIAAVVLLSEVITLPFIMGSALIFLGLFIAEGHLPYHHLHKTQIKNN